MFPLLFILILVILLGSILGFVAFSAVRRVESSLKAFPLNELTFRIHNLEKTLAELQKLTAAHAPRAETDEAPFPSVPPAPTEVPAPAKPAPTIPAQPSPLPPPPPRPCEVAASIPLLLPPIPKEPSANDLEALIGGRWFNRIGIIALLFAISYFLKLAFDNNWIGPAGRVAIGMVLGASMLPWSLWLLGRGYTYFSDGIAGLGEATLFVSVWAGCQYYSLFSRQIGFAALVLVVVVMALLALRRASQPVAFLSLLGGLLTPALMSRGENQQVMLFSYLLCLGAAALVIRWRKNWQILLPLAFVTTHLYFWQWYDSFYGRNLFLERTIVFVSLFFLLYSVIPTLRAFRQLELPPVDLLLVVANAVAYAIPLYVLLWPADRWPLTLFFLMLAAVHLGVASILPGSASSGSLGPRYLYLGLAVIFLTLAIPTKFDGNTITLTLTVEGGALAWIGLRSDGALLRPAGYILLGVAGFRLIFIPPAAKTFLWNERFASYLVLIAALLVPLWTAASPRDRESESGETEIASLSVACNFFALLALSLEFWDYLGRGSAASDHSLAQHLSISVLWTCYAGALILFGLLRHSALMRWQSLILLGIVVVKVFLIDLSSLDRAYRIFSFFVLGSALLAVSFLYQRKQARGRSSP
jgi:uncharacterized membrane protein